MKDEATITWPEVDAVGVVGSVEGHGDGDRKGYWQEWYARNKERIAEKRARLWRDDAAYRERENARRRAQRRAKAVLREPREQGDPWFEVEVEVGDHVEKAYTLGYVARRLGCSEALLRQWRLRGQLPPSPYRSGRWHLYTEGMIAAIVDARDRRLHVRGQRCVVGVDAEMGLELQQAWAKLGLKY